MVKQKSTLKAALAVLLALLTITTAVLLAACDTGTLDEDSMPTIHVESEDESSGDESSASQTQPGYADTPEIRDIVNITPDTIFVTGLCPVSYTHLDVYKRQSILRSRGCPIWRRRSTS